MRKLVILGLASSILLLILPTVLPAASQSPEELYGEYITPETRAILERSAQLEQEIQAARTADKARKTMALAIAVLIGLIPPFAVGRRMIRGKTWKENPEGTARALVVALAGGCVLFGLNYGVILLKIKMGDAFNTALAFLIVGALVAGSIFLLRKKGDG